MNKKMVFLLVLVLTVLAFALFNPYSISAAGPKQYKIIMGRQNDIERDVTAALNDGWTLVGGVGFDNNNREYLQALSK